MYGRPGLRSRVKAADAFAREYMDFLDNGKTERECVDTLVNQIEKAGYRELNELVEKGEKVKPGDKVYAREHEQVPAHVTRSESSR